MTGEAARNTAGPALMISYVIAGVTCIFAALCYAEFASMAPVAGSAYTYAYTTLGELFAWIIGLTAPVFTVLGEEISGRDLILIAGGLFLVWKATKEIHHSVDPDPEPDLFASGATGMSFSAAIGQILLLDLVFSLDSIITAVGMTDDEIKGWVAE